MKITVYTTSTCAFCVMVKKYLDSKGKKYEVINLDETPEARGEVEKISGGLSVPVTVFSGDNQAEPTVIVGWNPAKFGEALKL